MLTNFPNMNMCGIMRIYGFWATWNISKVCPISAKWIDDYVHRNSRKRNSTVMHLNINSFALNWSKLEAIDFNISAILSILSTITDPRTGTCIVVLAHVWNSNKFISFSACYVFQNISIYTICFSSGFSHFKWVNWKIIDFTLIACPDNMPGIVCKCKDAMKPSKVLLKVVYCHGP